MTGPALAPSDRPRRPPAAAVAGATPARHAALIGRALAHVDAHLDQPLDAPTLADRAAMSRHHFHRVFQAHVGCSVGSYITWRRLQRACALLLSGREPVLEVALAVGFDSAQSLAKALRRELGTTATAVRRGDAAPWDRLLQPARPDAAASAGPAGGSTPPVTITRLHTLAAQPPLCLLTATARGLVDHTLVRAARQAYGELIAAVDAAGLRHRVRSCLALSPDDPQGPDDPQCRYVAGVLFGHDLASGQGRCLQPELALHGSLAWHVLAPGRHAVFSHRGPFDTLHRTWRAIYRDALPASGLQLRDAPPLELVLTDPGRTPPALLHTEIWIPVV